jgi:hypothetical protein
MVGRQRPTTDSPVRADMDNQGSEDTTVGRLRWFTSSSNGGAHGESGEY